MAKPTKTHKDANPRLVKRGDVVQIKGTEQDEVVRSVSIVLHLANGQDVVYTVDEPVPVALNPDPGLEHAAAALAAEDEDGG